MGRWTLGIAAALMLAASPAYAHKLKVFATAVGPRIDGTAYFVGGGPAKGVALRIEAPDGATIATMQTDEDGRFAFTAAARVDHVIVVDAGDGHSATVTVPAGDLSATLPVIAGASAAGADKTASRTLASGNDHAVAAGVLVGPAAAFAPPPDLPAQTTAVQDAVATAVAQQIRPLRQQLNEYEDQVRLRDIVGGVGYIVGLAGLAAWLRAGRRRDTAR